MTPSNPSPTGAAPTRQSKPAAAEDFFIKIDGIVGESKDTKHSREIQIFSWGWGANTPTEAGSGMRTGRTAVRKFCFEAAVTKASVQLWKSMLQNARIKNAVFSARKAGGAQEDYLQITFDSVMIDKIDLATRTDRPDLPPSMLVTEQVELSFSKFDYVYREQTERGGLAGSYEVIFDLRSARGE